MQAASSVADARHELALDECVNVFVLLRGRRVEERLVGAGGEDGLQTVVDSLGIGGVQHAGSGQRTRPGAASAHIVLEEAPVEAKRAAECDERRIGIAFETS